MTSPPTGSIWSRTSRRFLAVGRTATFYDFRSVKAPNKLAFLSYLGFLCLIPLLINKDDEFVYFHTLQGLVLWIWLVIAIFALFIPFGAFFFTFSVLAVGAMCAMGIFSVLLGRKWRLPVVSYFVQHHLHRRR